MPDHTKYIWPYEKYIWSLSYIWYLVIIILNHYLALGACLLVNSLHLLENVPGHLVSLAMHQCEGCLIVYLTKNIIVSCGGNI